MVYKEMTKLDQIMDGALTERYNAELRKVLENVFDFRTDPNKIRSISLVIKFKPNAQRDAADMTTDVIVKTVPPKPLQQTVLMHMSDDGTITITERTDQLPGQLDINGEEAPLPETVEFHRPVRADEDSNIVPLKRPDAQSE